MKASDISGGAEGSGRVDPEGTIVELEKAALTRWGNGDPRGYIELTSQGISYFDPNLAQRLDGRAAFEQLMIPITGRIKIHKFDMPNAKVQLYGDVGILTFNLVEYDEDDKVTSRWNSTEVYHREQGKWKLVHSHWSRTESGEG